MSISAVRELQKQLEGIHLTVTVDEYETLFINKGPISVFILRRPPYCDRGRWIVHAESVDELLCTIDHHDLFPRYYFFNDCLVKELGQWIDVRYAQVLKNQEEYKKHIFTDNPI